MMRKAPNPKIQAPGKPQIPKHQTLDIALKSYPLKRGFCYPIGAWSFSGAWSLELGIFRARTLLVIFLQTFVALYLADSVAAQTRPVSDFHLTKIIKNLISTPQFAYTGAQQYATNERDRWLEVEVEFAAAPDFTDELTFKYFILLNGKLLTGEVTHINVAAGRENRSVMYVSPRTLARFMGNRAITARGTRSFSTSNGRLR